MSTTLHSGHAPWKPEVSRESKRDRWLAILMLLIIVVVMTLMAWLMASTPRSVELPFPYWMLP